MQERMKDASLLKTHTVLKSAGTFFTQSCTDRKVKRRLLCRGVFLFVSGWEVPSAADSLGANRFFFFCLFFLLSPRNTVHRNTRKVAYHHEKMLFQIENVNATLVTLILLHSFALNRPRRFISGCSSSVTLVVCIFPGKDTLLSAVQYVNMNPFHPSL